MPSFSLGDVERIYDTCGWMGLCPSCRAEGRAEGCQQHYVFTKVRALPDESVPPGEVWLIAGPEPEQCAKIVNVGEGDASP